MLTISHKTEGLSRPCSCWDVFTVAGGLQCGNCLAHNVKPFVGCSEPASDGPCPLPPDVGGHICWIHKAQIAYRKNRS
jgi:hypothetical protein